MRADRLLSFMLLLQSRGRMTISEIAQELNVSERTVYRDIDALSLASIPIYTQPGKYGGVFLDEDYRVSLTGLSKPEILSLFIASDSKPLDDLGLGKAVDDALLKLFAALPSIHRPEVERMRQRFYIDPMNWFQSSESPSVLPHLQQAVWEDPQIKIWYQAFNGEESERIVEAYALVCKATHWYLVASKKSDEMRNYRVSRLRHVELLNEHFERVDFDLATYWKHSSHQFEKFAATAPGYAVMLRVCMDTKLYFWIQIQGRYEQIAREGDWLTLRVLFESIDEACMCILSLGTEVEIIEPATLSAALIDRAKRLVEFHTSHNSPRTSY